MPTQTLTHTIKHVRKHTHAHTHTHTHTYACTHTAHSEERPSLLKTHGTVWGGSEQHDRLLRLQENNHGGISFSFLPFRTLGTCHILSKGHLQCFQVCLNETQTNNDLKEDQETLTLSVSLEIPGQRAFLSLTLWQRDPNYLT